MRRIWTGCLGLSLAWSGAGALAGEFAAARSEGPAASLGRPVAVLTPTKAEAERRPVADENITPVGHNLIGRPRALLAGRQEFAPLPPPTPVPSANPTDVWGASLNRPLGQPVANGVSPVQGNPLVDVHGIPEGVPGPDCCVPNWPYYGQSAPPSHCWVSGEYLLWWMRDSRLPPLVTTSPTGTTTDPGVLGAPGTGILFGNSKVNHDERSGGRFSVGWWFDECHDCGLDANFFFLGQRTVNYLASSGGDPILARPFFNALTNRESAQLVAFPGVVAGTVRVELPSRLWGADGNLRTNLYRGCNWHLDGLLGYRYLDLHESLGITEFLTDVRVPGQQSIIVVHDRFSARNQFHGGQIGLQWECRKGPWYLDVMGKLALGGTHQVVHIDGNTTFIPSGSTAVTQPGGLLAQRTNSGRYSRNEFSVVPEIGVKLGYQVTPHLRKFVGYNFLYWSNVARPADQIDRAVNPSQLPSIFGPGQLTGLARPTFVFRDTEFWAQGISFGLELRY